MRHLILATAVCIPLGWLSCSNNDQAVIEVGNPDLSGKVYDKQTNEPVPFAQVSLMRWDTSFTVTLSQTITRTNSQGGYKYDILPTGIYTLSISKDTKRSFRDTLYIDSASDTSIIDTIDYPASISGIVSMHYSDPPGSVDITVRQTHLTYLVDSSGTFLIDSLAKGRYAIRFKSNLDDYSPFDTVIEVVGGENLALGTPVNIPFNGIARVENVMGVWDTSLLKATISWMPLQSGSISGYNIYRSIGTQLPGSEPLCTALSSQMSIDDSSCDIGKTYSYYLKAIDLNGNIGKWISIPATITSVQRYEAVKTIPVSNVRLNNDFSPIAINNRNIYCINAASGRPVITVYDTAGVARELMLSSLVNPWNIKVYDTLLYIGDYADGFDPIEGEKITGVIKRFSLNGTFIDTISIKRPIENLATPYSGADFVRGPYGDLFFTNSTMVIRYRQNQTIAASRYPTDVLLSFLTRLDMGKGSIVTLSGYKTFGPPFCQIALLDTAKLTVKTKMDFPWWCQGFAADPASGNIYVIANTSTVYVVSEHLTVQEKFVVPSSRFYDIAVDITDGRIVLFDGKNIVSYRRK